jgi:methyl-accepting chemotaxis protein
VREKTMFKNMNITTKLISGFLSISLMLLVIGILGYQNIFSMSNNTKVIIEEFSLDNAENEIRASIYGIMVADAKMLTTTDQKTLEDMCKEYEDNDKNLENYSKTMLNDFVKDNKTVVKDQKIKTTVEQIIQIYNSEFKPITREVYDMMTSKVSAWNNSNNPALSAEELSAINVISVKSEATGDRILGLLDQLGEIVHEKVRDVTNSSMKISYAAKIESTVIIITGFILAFIMGIFITRSITRPINVVIQGLVVGAEQVASASEQLASASQQMAEASTQQASSLEETSSSLEEMSSMTTQNTSNAGQASSLASDARHSAESGNQYMNQLNNAMDEISRSGQETVKIVKTIEDIAFQTNLLALNAAVEAARAGSAGSGFAVVAEEVRNLAQRAGEAAKSTSQLISETTKRINNGVKIAEDTAKALQEINTNVQKVFDLLNEITVASREQSQGINQVNIAVAQMDKTTQANAANSEESASASQELSAQAQQLNEMVEQLRIVIDGDKFGRFIGNRHYSLQKPKDKNNGKHFVPSASGRFNYGKSTENMTQRKFAHRTISMDPEEQIPLNKDDFKDF